jgi:two-component system, NarL family, response regulator YdfI
MTRVLVIADSAVARAGLETMLRDDGRFEPAGHGATFGDLARSGLLGTGSHPDIILAEISDRSRLSSLIPAAEEAGGAALVLLMDDVRRNELLRALSSGVRAVLRRDATPQEIYAALEAAAAGLTTVGPDELDLLLPVAITAAPEDEAALDALSTREAEVLALMAQGLANKNIADRLHISEHTVKFHVSSILAKLGAASRTEAVTRGLKDGLLVI